MAERASNGQVDDGVSVMGQEAVNGTLGPWDGGDDCGVFSLVFFVESPYLCSLIWICFFFSLLWSLCLVFFSFYSELPSLLPVPLLLAIGLYMGVVAEQRSRVKWCRGPALLSFDVFLHVVVSPLFFDSSCFCLFLA